MPTVLVGLADEKVLSKTVPKNISVRTREKTPRSFLEERDWPAPNIKRKIPRMNYFSNTFQAVTVLSEPAVRRGRYGEILSIDGVDAAQIVRRFSAALPQTHSRFDGRGRGEALSVDLYGFDIAQDVAIVQIRQAYREKPRHFLSLRKTYVLVGFTEVGAPFRHPIGAMVVRRAVSADPDDAAAAVAAAQCWIWQVTKRQLRESLAAGMRQGDVLLVRAHAPKGGEDVGTGLAVGGSHAIRADRVVRSADGRVFALNPTLEHTKNQHAPVFCDSDGWFSVRAGREAPAWDFSPRFGD